MKLFLETTKMYCTVYKEEDSQYNNIVLIIDHVKIVTVVEDIVQSSAGRVCTVFLSGHFVCIVNAKHNIII